MRQIEVINCYNCSEGGVKKLKWYFSLLPQEEKSHDAEPRPATPTSRDRRSFACKKREITC